MNVAIVILADTTTPEAMGRVVNALVAAQEFKEAGDEVRIIFDGAAVKWPPVLAQLSHDYHNLYAGVQDRIAGVCEYCAGAYGVADQVRSADLPFAGEREGHPSFRRLMQDGYQIITF